jgi:thymidylate synthase
MDENKEEVQYLDLIREIMNDGFDERGRNGDTLSVFGRSMRFSLKDEQIPILTTKKVSWKTCVKELLWFIRGETDAKKLQKDGVHIWDANSSRKFLDSRGLNLYPEGMCGPIYGYQWRNFGANYNCFSGKHITDDYPYNGVDQLQEIIDQLKNPETRNSRRLVMTAWNPKQNHQMALPPCHVLCQFNVHGGNKLSCSMYQRSVDVMVGCPFNIASYAFLTHLIAKHCGLEPHEFVYFMGNCHIYKENLEGAKMQLSRTSYEFPRISIKQLRDNINDYQSDDFEILNYKCNEAIKFNMVA